MAKTGRINFGGGGGIDPDELNALPEHVLTNKIFGGSGSDEPQTGSMPNRGAVSQALNAGGSYTIPAGYHNGSGKVTANSLSSQTSATATAGYIYNGKTAWVNGSKITGNMTVGSILNFSAQAYSGRQILLKWQNPYAATGKPFSGVFINYSTSGYPGGGGTRIYTGAGNNSTSGNWSQVVVTLPNLNTTYYFSATSYCSCSAGDLHGNTINSSTKTQAESWLTFTSSQNYTIPSGFNTADFFTVGGGASGQAGELNLNGNGGGGGGSGYTSTVKNISVTSGQVLSIIVGSGGAASSSTTNNSGSISSITRNGATLCSAAGGSTSNYIGHGTNGGSGGGSAGYEHGNRGSVIGCNGGSNGSAGNGTDGYNGPAGGVLGGSYSGTGQGTTTRAWGSSTGTLYAGGGGGGGSTFGTQGVSSTGGGTGGAGGGGGGGNSSWTYDSDDLGTQYYAGSPGAAGSANTGSGGGGGGWQHRGVGYSLNGGTGGSGIALVHLY